MDAGTPIDPREAYAFLDDHLMRYEHRLIDFDTFLQKVVDNPQLRLRNIFQYFDNMLNFYIKSYERNGLTVYNTDSLFIEGNDEPFLVDNYFVDELLKFGRNMAGGTQENRLYLFEGPHGSGKSRFLSILIDKMQEYSRLDAGSRYEIVWSFDMSIRGKKTGQTLNESSFTVPCPNHDNPILVIPKEYRREFIDKLIPSQYYREMLFRSKEYDWVFKKECCSVCGAIFEALFQRYGDIGKVLSHVNARRYIFDKRIGRGIAVYNPADEIERKEVITNPEIQRLLNTFFLDSEKVLYLYSDYAYTNDGMYCLMDIKLNNEARLRNLHSVVTDKIHKVSRLQESIEALFLGVLNPEDEKSFESMESFQDRIIKFNIPYILNYEKELQLYHNKFSYSLAEFLPGILNIMAQIIVATRLQNQTFRTLEECMRDKKQKYGAFLDQHLLTLRVSMYSDQFPEWFDPEDKKEQDPSFFKALFAESRQHREGFHGISGRKALNIINDLLSISRQRKETTRGTYIDMDIVVERLQREADINDDILSAFRNIYDFSVTQAVKSSIFTYRPESLREDLLNYLFGITQDMDRPVKNPFLNRELVYTEEMMKDLEFRITGYPDAAKRRDFRQTELTTFSSTTLTEEMGFSKLPIDRTTQYKALMKLYIDNMKKDILRNIGPTETVLEALRQVDSDKFRLVDEKTRTGILLLLDNLVNRFNYDRPGAIQVSLYVFEKNLHQKY